MTRYSRQDLLRILRMPARQLKAWERAGLIPQSPGEDAPYTFSHVSQLQALRRMRAQGLSVGKIRTSLEEMRKLSGLRNPLSEATTERLGKDLVFRHAGALVDPITRQLAFDFGTAQWQGKPESQRALRHDLPAPNVSHQTSGAARGNLLQQVQEMFLRGVQCEESAATIPDAVKLYRGILALKPDHAPACINLGTIFYTERNFLRAEQMYRQATEADPSYALAFFDLGNVLDEMQRLDEAIEAYTRAITLVPHYADAHYNLALAFERQGERRRALRHWTTYIRLDPVGPWAMHAKGQTRKILSMERLSIVSRSGRKAVAG